MLSDSLVIVVLPTIIFLKSQLAVIGKKQLIQFQGLPFSELTDPIINIIHLIDFTAIQY
jgi:hypothetical protein